MKYLTGAASLFLLTTIAVSHPSAQKVSLPDVLKAAAAYIAQYSDRLQAVSAEEDYLQLEVSGGQMRATRRLISDVAFVGIGAGRVINYRDVFSMDGNVLRERDGRLLKLFQSTSADALVQAQQITHDGARRHISPNMQLFDEILAPLAVLRTEHQGQVRFKLDGVKTTDGVQVATLRFNEATPLPHVINSPIDEPASGKIFVEVATGTVRRTELAIADRHTNLRATVIFAPDATLGMWLPASLAVQSDITTAGGGDRNPKTSAPYGVHEALEGQAKYSKYQQAPVSFKVRVLSPGLKTRPPS
jgi:hypothetical protein